MLDEAEERVDHEGGRGRASAVRVRAESDLEPRPLAQRRDSINAAVLERARDLATLAAPARRGAARAGRPELSAEKPAAPEAEAGDAEPEEARPKRTTPSSN